MKRQNKINEAAEKVNTMKVLMNMQVAAENLAESLKDFLTNNKKDNQDLIDKAVYHMGILEALIKMLRQQFPNGLSTRIDQASDFIINELSGKEYNEDNVDDFMKKIKELCKEHGIKHVNIINLGDED